MTWTPLFVALLALAGALSLRNYLRIEVQGRGRLMAARGFAIGLLLLVLLAPAWVRPSVERLKPRIQLLVDVSGSMGRPLRPGGPTRLVAARKAVEELRSHYGDAFEFEEFHFGERLREGPGPAEARGGATDLAESLTGALRRGDPRTRALFLVSDGRSTRGAPPMLPARSAAYPVHTLGVGLVRDPRPNVSLLSLDAPEEGFREGEMKVRARVAFDRVPEGTRLPLELRVGDETVQTTSVTATGAETEVLLRWRPKRGGLQKIQLRVNSVEGLEDRVAEDDRVESSVRVRADPIPVLVLAGRPGADLAFLRRVLRSDPRFKVETVFGFGEKRPVELPPAGDAHALDQVPMVVIAGYAASLFPVPVQDALLAYLKERDGALLLLSNGAREWKELFASRLGTVLPFVAPAEYQPLEKRFGVDPATVNNHAITRILEHAQANQQAWQRLPPIAPGLRMKAASGVKVILGQPYYPRNIPLLASRPVGRGVVLALNSRETYLWSMLPRAHGDPEELHERFLARLAAWAADPGRVGGERIETSRLRYTPGEALEVRWKGPAGMEPPSRVIVETLEGGEEKASVTLGQRKGEGAGSLVAPGPGFYQLRPADGQAAPVPLAVHESREEVLHPDPDPTALRKVSDASGGSYLGVTGEGPLDGLPAIDAAPVVKHHSAGIYWLDVPQVMVALLLLFCLEWGMRRRRNLV